MIKNKEQYDKKVVEGKHKNGADVKEKRNSGK